MAGEIAHVIYAARLLTHLGDAVSHPSYWTGTVFSDIYRIGHVSRFPTHVRPIGLSNLIGANDFETGMRVHSWIDETQELYFREHASLEKLHWHPMLRFAFELFEDEFLYESYQDWNLIHRILTSVHPEEEKLIHNRPHIQAWHALLQNYFRSAPTDHSRTEYMERLLISSQTAREVNAMVADLRTNPVAKEILLKYIHALEHILR